MTLSHRPALLVALVVLGISLTNCTVHGADAEMRPVLPKPAANKKAAGKLAKPGLWQQVTSTTLKGRLLDIRAYQRLLHAEHPDEVLRCFPREAAVPLLAVGLEIGFDTILEAVAKPRQRIAIPFKDAEVFFETVTRKEFSGRISYQPQFTFQIKKAKPIQLPLGNGPGHPPGLSGP